MAANIQERFWCTRKYLLFERPFGNGVSLKRWIGSFEFGWLRDGEEEQLTSLQKDLTLKKIRERKSHEARCFVARREGKIAAFVWVSKKPVKVWDIRNEISLRPGQVYRYNAKVDVRYRGHGLFLRLVHHLEPILKGEGMEGFLIAIHPKNDVAIRTNQKDGFVQTGHVLYQRRLFWGKKERKNFFLCPAIVIGQGLTGLSVDRLLGKRGIPLVKVSEEDASSLGRRSRYGDFENISIGDTEKFLALLEKVGKRTRTLPALIPTNDQGVLWLSKERALFQQRSRYLFPDEKVMETFLDKKRFANEAAHLGFSVPQTRRIETEQDIKAVIHDKLFPCVLKPCNGDRFSYGKAKALWVSGEEELCQISSRLLQEKIPFLVQEAIPGEDSSHWSCVVYLNPNGEPLGVFTAQKIRQYPSLLGIASLCESKWNEEIAQQATSLLKRMHYVGVAEVEFKKDLRDGSFKILEVNPRLWIQHPLAARCGIDFAFLVYLGSLGIFPEKLGRQREGIQWSALDLDLLTVRQLFREGKMDVATWLGAYRFPLEPASFQWGDPRPAFYRMKEMVKNRRDG